MGHEEVARAEVKAALGASGYPQPINRSSEPVQLLEALRAALPDLQRHGVRRLQLGAMTVELDRVGGFTVESGDGQGAREAGAQPLAIPGPGESDELDVAAVE